MKLRHLPQRLVILSILVSGALAPRMAFAQAAGTPEQAAEAASQLFEAGQYKESADAYLDVVTKYPTSTVIATSQFRLGYLYYVLGEYDKSIDYLKKILTPPASPEIQELGYSLIPQALAARASKQTDEAKRKAGFEDAIKEFDVFLQKYPASDEIEGTVYGRALASYQITKYEDAIASLRSNLARFAKSESILDSQYLLALTLATKASVAMQADQGASNAAAGGEYDEAGRLLGDIIAKRTDIALLNDAQFQIGEILFNRGALGPKEERDGFWAKAIDAYRGVLPKEPMIKAQEARVADVQRRKVLALQTKDTKGMARMDRLKKNEIGKLAAIKEKADVTVSAAIKVGQIFFQQNDYDAARILFRQMQQFAEDDEQKKAIQYYLTLSYAYQKLTDKAVDGYNQFQAAYKGDPMGDNLPLVIGGLFLTNDPKTNDPAKACDYFKEGLQLYPKGRFVDETFTQQANALIMLKRYDEALKSFQDFLKRNPKPAQACAAEFGIATVYKETDKIPEAVAAFKKVREKYAGTPQAEQSSFWVGQLELQKGDIAAAIPELTAFLKNFPKSELFPTAKFGLAQANLAKNDKPTALQLFKEVSDEFPKSAPATFCYFQRASVLAGDQKVDEMMALMKEFIKNYPDDDKIFYAYDTVGQNLINTSKPDEAIAMYEEMVDKHPNDQHASQALVNLVQLWHQHTTAQGRYLALNEEQRAEWNKGIANSTANAEKLITQFPASTQVATTLQELIEDQKLLVGAKLKTDTDLTKYFQDLAGKFGDKPDTKSKILFTLAAFIYDSDKAKGLELMKSAYNPQLVFAPEDIDLYGGALLEQGNVDDSAAVYQKLANDFPIPAGVTADKAPPQVQAAQAIALYGAGKAQQKQGKVAEAGATFDKLKTLYPWSPKLLEANFGIAEAMHQQQKEDDAILLLGQIIRAQTATAELRANSMLLLGDIQLSKNDIAAAIDQYIKIPVFYESVPKAASEGLWRGAQLLEKQAATLPETPVKKGDATKPGQLAKAVRAYQDIVSKYPASEHGKDAKARLDSLQPPRN